MGGAVLGKASAGRFRDMVEGTERVVDAEATGGGTTGGTGVALAEEAVDVVAVVDADVSSNSD